MSTKSTGTRDYLIVTGEGEFKITIPEDYKITFGPISPGTRSYDGHALRIYESDTKQRAIFTNVQSFRDLSIPVLKKIKAVTKAGASLRDGKGNSSAYEEVQVDESWEEQGE